MNYPSYFPPLSSHRSPMKRSTKIPRLNHLRRLGGDLNNKISNRIQDIRTRPEGEQGARQKRGPRTGSAR